MFKPLTIAIFILTGLCGMQLFACKQHSASYLPTHFNNNAGADTITMKVKITVGKAVFTATLHNNATATTFKALLPITLNMTELNGNEKYAGLAADLPTKASNPGTIQNGDLMLYGSNTLVVFYKTFSTSYSYTAIGRIENPEALAAALGRGNATVTFAAE